MARQQQLDMGGQGCMVRGRQETLNIYFKDKCITVKQLLNQKLAGEHLPRRALALAMSVATTHQRLLPPVMETRS